MEIRKDQFPVVIQAYEITDDKEVFIAEQLVTNQSEINVFSNRYAGKLIKARQLTSAESGRSHQTTHTKKGSSSAGTIFLIVIIILVILLAIGFFTGWIQQTFGI